MARVMPILFKLQQPFEMRGFAPVVPNYQTTSGWTPSSITATPLVCWYDPSDITTLFTDTAGTNPVTSDGDAVALMKDKSGNGNHVSQATLGSRPLYRSGGYLDFDGVDDSLSTSGNIVLTDGSGRHSAGAAFNFNNNTGTQSVLDADNFSGGTRVSQLLRNNAGAVQTIAFDSGGVPYTDSGPGITAATGVVLTERTSTTTTEGFVGGTGDGTTAVTAPMQSGATPLRVGASLPSNGQYAGGRFYGSANYQGALSSSDHAQLVAYLTAKIAAATSTATITPLTGHLVFTGYQPSITTINAISPSTGHLTFGGKVPSVSLTVALSPATGHLTFGGKTPTISVGTLVNPLTGHLTFTGYIPTITRTTGITPATGHISFGGKVPSVSLTTNLSPSTGHLTFTGKTPSLILGITPVTGHLVFTGYVPDVSGATVASSALPLKVQYRHRGRNC